MAGTQTTVVKSGRIDPSVWNTDVYRLRFSMYSGQKYGRNTAQNEFATGTCA